MSVVEANVEELLEEGASVITRRVRRPWCAFFTFVASSVLLFAAPSTLASA